MNGSSQLPDAAGTKATLTALIVKHSHALKYLLIGGSASLLDVLLFLLLYNVLHQTELVSHSISVPTSVLFSFALNARHNFKTNDHMWLRLLSFCVVCFIGFWAGYLVIMTFEHLGLGANIGKIASLPVVFIIQYILNTRVTFRKASA